MPAIVGFVKSCKWTQVSVLLTRAITFKSTAARLSQELVLSKLSVLASMIFDDDVEDASDQLKAIRELRSSRVVVAMALESTYWKIALNAYNSGMVSGWAWLGLDVVSKAADYAPADQRMTVDLAFNGWVYFEPHFSAGQDFFDRVHNATRSDFPTFFDENVLPSPYAAAMYDAITLFATVANEQNWLPHQGGRVFLNRSIENNMSFEGATGSVKLETNGGPLLPYQAVNFVLKNGASQRIVVGVFAARTQSYASSGMAIIWPGGLLAVPADVAVENGFNTTWILVGASVTALVVVSGLVVLVRRRHAHLQAILTMLLTEMGMLVLSICTAIANLVTDGIVFGRLLRGELTVSTAIYTAAYATILCFGVVVTALSLGYRIRNAYLMKAQLQELASQGQSVVAGSASAARRQLQQHEWELVQTHRTKVTLALSLATVATKGARAHYGVGACA
jgi:hypothetical protein